MADDNQIFRDKTTGKLWRKSGTGYVAVQAPPTASSETERSRSGLLERIKSFLIAGPEERGSYLRNRTRPDLPLDSGENPRLGNPTGTKPIAKELGTAGTLSNFGADVSPMGMPEARLFPNLTRVGRDVGAVAGEGAKVAGRGASRVGGELLGAKSAPSMERLAAAQDMTTQAAQSTLQKLSTATRTNASRYLEAAVTHADNASPEGVVSKASFATEASSILDKHVKIDLSQPTAIKAVTEAPESELGQASVFKGGGKTSGASGGHINEAMTSRYATQYGSLEKLNEFLRQVGAAPVEDTMKQGWTARQLQQLRTQLYDVAFGRKSANLPSAMRNAAKEIYSLASDKLDASMAKAKVSDLWDAGNVRWKLHKEVFEGKYINGDFQESPIYKALTGQNAADIGGPLIGDNRLLVRKLLNQYNGKFDFQLKDFEQNLNRFEKLRGIEQQSHPSKWEYAAAMSTVTPIPGSSFIGAYGLTRLLTPVIRRLLATRGVDPDLILKGYEPIGEGPKLPPPPAEGGQ